MPKKLLFVISAIVLTSGCKERTSATQLKIYHGSDFVFNRAIVPITAHGVDVYGRIKPDIAGACTGTFLNRTILITALHCTIDDDGKPLQIKYNGTFSEGVYVIPETVAEQKVIMDAIAKKYKEPFVKLDRDTAEAIPKDIALVRFPRRATENLSDLTSFPKLIGKDTNLDQISKIVIAGYGITQPGGSDFGKFHYTDATLGERKGNLLEARCYAGTNCGFILAGDSGGPVHTRPPEGSKGNYVFAIMSWGSPADISNKYAVMYAASVTSPEAIKLFQESRDAGDERFEFDSTPR